jgi:hypothetical protein
MPFFNGDVCPGECCKYTEWRVNKAVSIRTDRRPTSPVAFSLRAGETVTAVTGGLLTTTPGQVKIVKPEWVSIWRSSDKQTQRPFSGEPGTVVTLLGYYGEGYYSAWIDGELVTIKGGLHTPAECAASPCGGEILVQPTVEWWVQVKNPTNQVGWAEVKDNFVTPGCR